MGKSSFTREQREIIAQEAIEAKNKRAVAEKYEISPALVYSWVKSYKNQKVQEKNKTSKEYEKELEEIRLENQVLKELLKKTTQTLIKE